MTDILAVYGAVVGSAAAIGVAWNVWRDWPRLKISISRGHLDPGPNEPLVFVEAVNVSRRPITINGGGGLGFQNGSRILFNNGAQELPREVREGQSITLWCGHGTLKESLERHDESPTYIWFKDASGKLHRSRIPSGFRKWLAQVAGGAR